jgi:DNA invertase Pin-like site-specific DNA recombinase
MHDTFACVMQVLAGKCVGLRALNSPDLDITSAQGKLMLNVLSAISEFERSEVQQFADFFLNARNLRIEVIDVF